MDIHYVEVRYKIKELRNFDKLIKILPKQVGLVSTLQYLDIAQSIKKELEKLGFEVFTKRGKTLFYDMQILGCNIEAADLNIDTILFIGNSKFHALQIKRELRKEVIMYDPLSGEILSIHDDEKFYKKISLLLYKLKESRKIGIITSIKPGQYRIKEVLKLKEYLEKLDKKVYLFLADNINFKEFINFPTIEFWIIVACPRLIDDILEENISAITIEILRKYGRHHGFSKIP